MIKNRIVLIAFLSVFGLLAFTGQTASAAITHPIPNVHESGPFHINSPDSDVINEVCQSDRGQLCTNSSECAYSSGSDVLGWAAGNDCNNFTFDWLYQTCGNGVVTLTCPSFGNGNINKNYQGALIISIAVHNPDGEGSNLCVALNGQLDTCPNDSGNGGGTATIFVTNDCDQLLTCSITGLLNRYWTEANGYLSWYYIPTLQGQRVVMGYNEFTQYAWFVS